MIPTHHYYSADGRRRRLRVVRPAGSRHVEASATRRLSDGARQPRLRPSSGRLAARSAPFLYYFVIIAFYMLGRIRATRYSSSTSRPSSCHTPTLPWRCSLARSWRSTSARHALSLGASTPRSDRVSRSLSLTRSRMVLLFSNDGLRSPCRPERLHRTADNQVVVSLPRPWRDETTAIVLSPLELIERLPILGAAAAREPPLVSWRAGRPLGLAGGDHGSVCAGTRDVRAPETGRGGDRR